MASILAVIGRYVGTALVGYLCGSIPSGVVAGRLLGNVDPRQSGSGKTGATNVLRTLGPGAAALVALTDLLKGVAPVLLARYVIFPSQPLFFPVEAGTENLALWAETIGGFSALLGHNYSLFIGFKGGRGVATGGGAIFAMQPLAGVCGIFGFVIPVALTRYVSLGSMIAGVTIAVADAVFVAAPKSFPIHDAYQHLVFMTAGAAFVIYSHRDNIARLRNGTERKLGQKDEPVTTSSREPAHR
jgi:acyl phosphate:glycerol-3-phosphate acyltransferase